MHSTISKSASEDFSLQSQLNQGRGAAHVAHSGFTTPQLSGINPFPPNYSMSLANKHQQFNNRSDSIFESPIPRSHLETSSFNKIHMGSQDQEEDEEGAHNMHLRFVEQLVGDDNYSGPEEGLSYTSVHSPELVGNRFPSQFAP